MPKGIRKRESKKKFSERMKRIGFSDNDIEQLYKYYAYTESPGRLPTKEELKENAENFYRELSAEDLDDGDLRSLGKVSLDVQKELKGLPDFDNICKLLTKLRNSMADYLDKYLPSGYKVHFPLSFKNGVFVSIPFLDKEKRISLEKYCEQNNLDSSELNKFLNFLGSIYRAHEFINQGMLEPALFYMYMLGFCVGQYQFEPFIPNILHSIKARPKSKEEKRLKWGKIYYEKSCELMNKKTGDVLARANQAQKEAKEFVIKLHEKEEGKPITVRTIQRYQRDYQKSIGLF